MTDPCLEWVCIEQKVDVKVTEKTFCFKGGDFELTFDLFGEVRFAPPSIFSTKFLQPIHASAPELTAGAAK